jgi:hypothetical protein
MLWTSAKGSRLLDKINEETGSVFDKENYEIIVSQTDEVDGLVLGHFATEQPSRMTARHRGDTGRGHDINLSAGDKPPLRVQP